MTKSTITRERAQQIFLGNGPEPSASEERELARMALAAMDSEPDCKERKLFCSTDTARMRKVISVSAGTGDAPLYRHAPPAPERDQVRREHAEWSQATFGNVGPVGPLKHLSKEALEAAEQPGDLSEWADMQFLLWDAQRRAGITDEQITQAMIDKLAVNKQREWPEPKDGEPRLHIKEQPALTGNSPIIGIDLASGPDRTVEVRYVAPPGYVMVPREPTDEMIAAAMNCEDVLFNSDDSFCVQFGNIYEAMLAAAPQEDINALIPLVSRNEREVK